MAPDAHGKQNMMIETIIPTLNNGADLSEHGGQCFGPKRCGISIDHGGG